ncbi:hypothetical protein EDD36DRAFT_419775 [Exophiala viscosa]|uniref:DUF7053 domain-containing protein n=1 Tax=Exophiala viscosa TaxID=2486360 RepID=A0AAN6DVB5_9EURO|nr:hypothetical protein EDD36DRAFT_419775 [Exophiala viscosa]
MMKKKSVYANITPIPSQIPRQLAIDMLHSHGEIIELNPLVTGYKPVKAPQNAPSDEFFSTWYEISQRIQYIPGMGKMGSGKISFKGVFHDMPWGLQTHVYAAMGVDIRNKWQIRGNQPGEPPETKELGSGAPADGLYLREDIEIKCNPAMISFVKKELKAASKIMVDRMVKKAELIDSGQLSAMMEDGRLKTLNPADRSQTSGPGQYSPTSMMTPKSPYGPMSPGLPDRRQSAYGRQSQYGHDRQSQYGSVPLAPQQGLAIEMPGSTQYATVQDNQRLQPPNRFSTAVSELSASTPSPGQTMFVNSSASDRQSYAGSVSSHPTSHDQEGMSSPGLDKRSFAAELPANEGMSASWGSRSPDPNGQQGQQYRSPDPNAQQGQQHSSPDQNSYQWQQYRSDSNGTPGQQYRGSDRGSQPGSPDPNQQYRYNPQDYARMS